MPSVKLHSKLPDWFSWENPPLEFMQQNTDLPGLKFSFNSLKQVVVDFHISHLPCMPEDIREIAIKQRPLIGVSSSLLRPYQLDDWHFLEGLRGALLCYEMRLGKTALACCLHDPKTGAIVITGPLAAREAWRDWVNRVYDFPLCCLSGRDTHEEWQEGFPAYFCHFDILGSHTDLFQRMKIGTLVLDEVHLWQGKSTQRMQAVSLLGSNVGKILGLSGTPVWNKPKSLYHLLHLIFPGAWGTRFQFMKRYADAQPGAHGWNYEGISNADELRSRLAHVMVRRTWKDVAPELPPTTRVLEPVSLTGAQYTALETAAMKASLARGTSNEAGYLATLRRKMAEIKIKPAIAIAMQAADDGHKVVLWTWHNEIGDKVFSHLWQWNQNAVFRIQSSDPARVRDQSIEAFRAHDGPAYMVAAIGTAGVGLDLSCSDYAIFVELDWTPANVYQAEMRTFHISRPHVVVVFYTDDPVESKLVQALDVKNGYANALGLGSADVMKAVLS